MERLREIVHYILRSYPDKRVSTRQLEKLVYMAELEAIDRYGERLTDLRYIRDDFGPCSWELLRLSVDEFDHEEFAFGGGTGRAFRRPRARKYKLIDDRDRELIDSVVGTWRHRRPDDLVERTRGTPPYQEAELYHDIDLERYKRAADTLYRDPDLPRQLEEAREEIREGKGTRVSTRKELEEFLASM